MLEKLVERKERENPSSPPKEPEVSEATFFQKAKNLISHKVVTK